jgi:glutathione synthase/RimK-type ligase-like ATP-grasp enzyme
MNSMSSDSNSTYTQPTKALAIFCRTLDKGGDPFTNDYYWNAYQDLMLCVKERGVAAYLVTQGSYLGGGVFAEAFTVESKTSLENMTRHENVHVDVVVNRAEFYADDVLIINDPYVHKIATNKVEMYKIFPEFQPTSVICTDMDAVKQAFQDLPGDMIVVKEPESYGGYDVYIGKKDEIYPIVPEHYPLLVQEFLDTSIGIPGYITGVHDIRITVCGGTIVGYNARKAKPGMYHSNVAQGGTLEYFDVSEIPNEVVEAVHAIDQKFIDHPRYYSTDFVNSPKGWKMLELNALLAFIPLTNGPHAAKIIYALADYLSDVAKNYQPS